MQAEDTIVDRELPPYSQKVSIGTAPRPSQKAPPPLPRVQRSASEPPATSLFLLPILRPQDCAGTEIGAEAFEVDACGSEPDASLLPARTSALARPVAWLRVLAVFAFQVVLALAAWLRGALPRLARGARARLASEWRRARASVGPGI
jgi:hypothetical protein